MMFVHHCNKFGETKLLVPYLYYLNNNNKKFIYKFYKIHTRVENCIRPKFNIKGKNCHFGVQNDIQILDEY